MENDLTKLHEENKKQNRREYLIYYTVRSIVVTLIGVMAFVILYMLMVKIGWRIY